MISKVSKGFTLVEIMIVVVIVGILAAIAIPNFLNLKDKATWGTARANLEVVRTALADYAADNELNRYPLGTHLFTAFRSVVPDANLPINEPLSKLQTGSFAYTSEDGRSFTITTNADNRTHDQMVVTPGGVTPATYDDYVR